MSKLFGMFVASVVGRTNRPVKLLYYAKASNLQFRDEEILTSYA
jgi:hypothetical protein